MISPVTIYVPVPGGVANRPGAAPRSATETDARKPGPVRAVERIAPGDPRGQPGARFQAIPDDRAAEGLAARRRVRPLRRDELEDSGPNAEAVGEVPAPNEAATAPAPPAPAPPPPPGGRALTAPLDGPGRPLAINAVYRTIEGFGGDMALRGAIFDFNV